MSTTVQPKQSIAVLGATGGCVLNFLIRALQNGHTVSALARTPSKLTSLLKENEITDDLLTNLTIVQGNSKDETNVTEALKISGKVVDTIVSGIGAIPVFKGLRPSIEDPLICQATMASILKSLTRIRESSPSSYKKPILISISTTGISEYGRDVPLPYTVLYPLLGSIPHRDKKVMERMIKTEGASKGSVLGGWIIVRPSFLWGKKGKGLEKVRVGVESGESTMPKAAIGYTIPRVDVGRWIYGALVEDEGRGKYLNRCLGITT